MIRLQKVGKKNSATFRIVLIEKTQGAKKRALEKLGFWDPRLKKLNLNIERIKYWLSKGAQVSATVNNFLVAKKIIEGKKIPKHKIALATLEVSKEDAAMTGQPAG